MIDRPKQGRRNQTNHRVGEWHGRARWADATVQQARALRAEGWTFRAIGKRLGVPLRTVADWCWGASRWAS